MNLYTDLDPKACAWTEELIASSLIAPGYVLCKSVTDLEPHELENFTQIHFFNGIAGWARALDLAGWPRTRPVWCASLPCQSFSCAGNGKGFGDDRGNLWFPFLRLVRECRPVTIFGEQVKAAVGHGWLDRIFTDLEAEGYTCGAVVLGAHSGGAPHLRQRLCWVAHSKHDAGRPDQPGRGPEGRAANGCHSEAGGLAHATSGELGANGSASGSARHAQQCGQVSGLADTQLRRSQQCDPSERPVSKLDPNGAAGGLVHTQPPGLERHAGNGHHGDQPGRFGTLTAGPVASEGESGFWDGAIWHPCRDGKARRIPGVESVFQRMATGLPEGMDLGGAEGGFPLGPKIKGRVALLKGYGNAITAPVVAEFVRAYLECEAAKK